MMMNANEKTKNTKAQKPPTLKSWPEIVGTHRKSDRSGGEYFWEQLGGK